MKKIDSINPLVEDFLSEVSIEDLIFLKFKLARNLFKDKLYNVPLSSRVEDIVNVALLRFVKSVFVVEEDRASFLGLSLSEYQNKLNQFKERLQDFVL